MLMYDENYQVELYDVVEVRIDRHTHMGIVTRLFPRAGEVQVRYQDELDATRSGSPRRKSGRVPVRDVDLLERDG
jgi:hypothetical protein